MTQKDTKGSDPFVSRRSDGSYHPNFKPMKVDKDFSTARYASGVANELLWALEGLVEEVKGED